MWSWPPNNSWPGCAHRATLRLSFGFMEALRIDNSPAQRGSPAEGTFRRHGRSWRHEARKALASLIQSTCQAHGCEPTWTSASAILR